MPEQAILLAVSLVAVGLAVGYATSLPYLAPGGRIAAALIGAALGLALARALWVTRHGEPPVESAEPEPGVPEGAPVTDSTKAE